MTTREQRLEQKRKREAKAYSGKPFHEYPEYVEEDYLKGSASLAPILLKLADEVGCHCEDLAVRGARTPCSGCKVLAEFDAWLDAGAEETPATSSQTTPPQR